MSASITSTKKKLSMDFIKRTAGYVSSAAGEYISSNMEVSSSTLTEAKSTITKVSSTLTSKTQEVIPKIRNLKYQHPMRAIYKWYMEKEDEFDDSSFDSDLQLDIDTDSSEIADVQIGEAEKNSNKISKAVIESSKQMVESQVIATANLQSTLDKQTAVITAGFDKTNETLNKILEVVTKNTSTLIEATAAINSDKDKDGSSITDMAKNWKFNLSSYKKMVTSNAQNSMPFIYASVAKSILSDNLNPSDLIKMGFEALVNKFAPNVPKNLKAIDDVINDTLMHSIVRLGDNARKNPFSYSGMISKMFGLDTSRQEQYTDRPTLEVKSVPFDSVTRESITNTIPGYLRKILAAISGNDFVYDYRSRTFKNQEDIKKEFYNNAAPGGSIHDATSKVRDIIGTDKAAEVYYEMLLTRLGAEKDVAKTLESFKDRKVLAAYMNDKVIKGMELDKPERKRYGNFINDFAKLTGSNNGIMDVRMQVAKNNIARNNRVRDYIEDANNKEVDLSFIQDSLDEELKAIAARAGKPIKDSDATIAEHSNSGSILSGTDYTNLALYQIFRRLDTGINVFQVGRSNKQKEKFESWKEKALVPPVNSKVKPIREPEESSSLASVSNAVLSPIEETDTNSNLLKNQILEDGEIESLTGWERFKRWGNKRGGDLRRAIFSKSPEEVRAVFASMISDVSDLAKDEMQKGVSKINSSFGNVSGYLQHKMFGTDYSYDEIDENGNKVTRHMTSKHDDAKGGIFGFVTDEIKNSFTNSKKSFGNWINTVKGYFDYGEQSGDPEERKVASKRKKLIFGSIGAYAGAGLLGGPIGMLVGALAGNALSSFNIGSKIKDLLFGHDKNSGKPTGIIAKATDSIITPIKFQVGKTLHLFGATLQKHILGPFSDIGLAIKDRITNHVDSVFDTIKKGIKGFFRMTFGKLFGLLGKGLLGLGTATGRLLGITLPGKASRGAIGVGGALIGGAQNIIAGKIAKNSYHKLSEKDGKYTVKRGEKYRDADGKVKVAQFDQEFTSADRVSVSSNDYIKRRRKARNEDIKDNLKETVYYSSNPIKGFFGGDYKAFREQEWERNRDRRNRFGKYFEEREKTPAELTKEEEARKAAEETAKNTQKIADRQSTLADKIEGEIIPGSSFKTHDKGMHDRLDDIIDIISGKKHLKNSTNTSADEYASSVISAAASLSTGSNEINSSESKVYGKIIDDATKDGASKATLNQDLKEMINLQRKDTDEDGKEDKKESIFEKIANTISDTFDGDTIGEKIKSGFIAGITGFVGFSDLKSFYSNVIKGDMNFSEWWGEESKIGKAINGLVDMSQFIGSTGGPIVNKISDGIESITSSIPGMPKISPPRIDTTGMFSGLSTGILGGLYLKGLSAIGSIAAALANLGSNGGATGAITNLFKGLFENPVTGAGLNLMGALGIGLAAKSYMDGPEIHENTDAAGNDIVDIDATRSMRSYGTKVAFGKGLNKLAESVPGIAGKKMQQKLAEQGIETAVSKTGKLLYRKEGKFVANSVIEGITGMPKNEASEQILKYVKSKSDDVVSNSKVMEIIKKVFTGMKNFLMKNKTFSKFSNIISTKFDDLLLTISKSSNKVIQKMPNKVAKIMAKGAASDAQGALTLGTGYAVMAFGGALSGGLSAANIFNVREKDVNGTMRTVASVVVAMLNAVPKLWALELVDLIIQPMTIRRFICELLYNLLGGTEDLDEKQATFSADVDAYNSKYNANLSIDEYNDMTNKGMLSKIFGKGGVKTDESGRAMTDDAGEVLRTNHGIAGWFAGGEKVYARDANGEIIRDQNGKAVQAIDKDGNKLTKNKTWTDHIRSFFHNTGQFFGGKTEYELDQNGEIVYDENGNPIVKGKGKNLLQRIGINNTKDAAGALLGGIWNGAKNTVINPISSILFAPIHAVKTVADRYNKQENEIGEDGKPLVDADGKVVKKGKLSDTIIKGIARVTSFLTNPIQSMIDGAEEWEKKESPWKKNTSGKKTASEWLKSKATTLFNTVSGWFDTSGSNKSSSSSSWARHGGIGGPDEYDDNLQLSNANVTSNQSVNAGKNLNADYASKVKELLAMYGQSSQYGWRTINGESNWHNGVDLTKAKNSDVPSFTAGTVERVANDVAPDSGSYTNYQKGSGGGYGNMVVVKDDKGNYNYYAHLNATKVNVGDKVQVGQPLGLLGHTGNSTGPHLHYEVRNSSNKYDKGINSYNPLQYLSSMYNTNNIGTGYTYGVENVEGGTSSSSGGALANLLSWLKKLGAKFLNKISGGLFGESSDDSEASINSSGQSYASLYKGPGSILAASMLDPDKSIQLLTNAQVNALNGISAGKALVIDLKSGISYDIFWGGKPGKTHTDYSTLTSEDTDKKISAAKSDGGKYPDWTPRPCILVIGDYQIAVGTHNYNHGSIIGGSPGSKCPNMPNSKPSNQDWPPGGHYCMYYKDSISNANGLSQNAKDHQKAAAEAYKMAKQMIEELKKVKATIADSGNGEGIYDYLRSQGYTAEGAAAVLGNIYAESGLNPLNLQNSYENSLGYTDESYTNSVDSGAYTRDQFINDSAGYGLAQWTYSSRKQGLYDTAKAAKVSIGHLGLQSAYLANELSNYGLDSEIKNASDVGSATRAMMLKFEKPADQSQSAQSKRVNNAIGYYSKYKNRSLPQASIYPKKYDGNLELSLGGPEDDNDFGSGSSIFNQPKYVPNDILSNSNKTSYNTNRNIGGIGDSITPKNSLSGNIETYSVTNNSNDNDSIMKVLNEVLTELRYITKNTGNSSDLLGDLNSKDFVDQGLRNSLSSLRSNRSKSSVGRTAQAVRTNTRTITAMARP